MRHDGLLRRIAAVISVALVAACSSNSPQAAPATTTTTTPCAPPPTGETRETLQSGGVARTYIRRVVAAPGRVPVIIDLHGYSEGADIHVKFSGLGDYGASHGFDTITPQGLGNPSRWDTGLDSPDVRYVSDLIDMATKTMCADSSRIFVTGLSNGAFLASTVACALADRVAAVAPVAGVRDPEGCKPVRPIPVLAIHGTADQFVAYDGGLGPAVANLPAPDGSGRTIGEAGGLGTDRQALPVPDIVAAWARRDGCDTTPSTTKVTDDVDEIAYRCPAGLDVQLYRVNGGGHTWPGSAFGAAAEKLIGRTTMSISANDVIWRFFQAHPRR